MFKLPFHEGLKLGFEDPQILLGYARFILARDPTRHAALRLATTVLIIGRLIDYRNRWSPNPTPT